MILLCQSSVLSFALIKVLATYFGYIYFETMCCLSLNPGEVFDTKVVQ